MFCQLEDKILCAKRVKPAQLSDREAKTIDPSPENQCPDSMFPAKRTAYFLLVLKMQKRISLSPDPL